MANPHHYPWKLPVLIPLWILQLLVAFVFLLFTPIIANMNLNQHPGLNHKYVFFFLEAFLSIEKRPFNLTLTLLHVQMLDDHHSIHLPHPTRPHRDISIHSAEVKHTLIYPLAVDKSYAFGRRVACP